NSVEGTMMPELFTSQTSVISRSHGSVLKMFKTCGLELPTITVPKSIGPLTPMSLTGAMPFTVTIFIGVAGSSLVMVILPDFMPVLAGVKRTITSRILPGGMTIGKGGRAGSVNSGEFDVMFDIVKLQSPVFLIVSGRSLNVPKQTLPKSSGS